MSPRKKKVTLGQMVVRGGWLNARRALKFASRYGIACEALGHPPTMAEYGAFHGISPASSFRDQKAWRDCVGDVSVLEAVSDEALAKRGMTEADREAAIARWLAS